MSYRHRTELLRRPLYSLSKLVPTRVCKQTTPSLPHRSERKFLQSLAPQGSVEPARKKRRVHEPRQFSDLPLELVAECLSYLDVWTLWRLRQVSQGVRYCLTSAPCKQ